MTGVVGAGYILLCAKRVNGSAASSPSGADVECFNQLA